MAEKKKSYYTPASKVIAVSQNPWAGELVHTIKKGRKVTGFASAKHSLVNQNTGEIAGDMAVIGVQKVVDREEFIKFFGAGIEEVFELAKPAKDLFRAILRVYLDQKHQPDQLFLSYEEIHANYGYDKLRSSYYNGLNELCVKGFMAPVELRDKHFWVNPNLFYKGDRIRIVHDYVRAGTKAAKQLEAEQAKAKQGDLALENPNLVDDD